MKTILAYDLGTSGVKASLYTAEGRLLAAEYAQYSTLYPAKEYREQRPSDWWAAMRKTTVSIMTEHDVGTIAAIGVSGHSLGTIAVDRTGKLLSPTTPIWSDARAVQQADLFFRNTDEKDWYTITGNGFPRHLYALFKQMWLRDHMPELYRETACFLGSKDYINFMLTGVMATDPSYASGSGVYDLRVGAYNTDFLKTAGISPQKLPEILPSHAVIGYVTPEAAETLSVCPGIPVVAGGVDNACMTLGAGCWRPGDAYASLGSSAWITVCSDKPAVSYETRLYTFAHCVDGMYIPSAGIFASGFALDWMRNTLHLGMNGAENSYTTLRTLAESAPAGANGLLFVPNLAGGSSFDPSPDVRGLLAGLDLIHTEADVVRAVYEGIAMHLRCAYDALAVYSPVRQMLRLVGGGAKCDAWRQIYASVFGLPVQKTAVVQDAASLGAAALAAKGTGLWADYSTLDILHTSGEITYPREDTADLYRELLARYKKVCLLTDSIAKIMKG